MLLRASTLPTFSSEAPVLGTGLKHRRIEICGITEREGAISSGTTQSVQKASSDSLNIAGIQQKSQILWGKKYLWKTTKTAI